MKEKRHTLWVEDLLARPFFIATKKAELCCCIDTSTLIYLEKIGLMEQALVVFAPFTLSQVLAEFGSYPKGLALYGSEQAQTDSALLDVALDRQAVLLSEDRRLLLQAEKKGLEYYNCLMLVLALYSRGKVHHAQCVHLLEKLRSVARYSEEVWDYGQQVWHYLRRVCRG